MTARQRRGELFGIFYRTPDARSRRIVKMLDIANAIAEKREKL